MNKTYVPSIRVQRVRTLAKKMTGDPSNVFYGDVVEVQPENAAPAIGHEEPASSVVESAIVESAPSDMVAAQRVAAYNAMSDSDKAQRTLLPPLATWNAMVVINPLLGKVLAKALDYMLLKALNDYPYEGNVVAGTYNNGRYTVVIDGSTLGMDSSQVRLAAIPFFRFTIASSALNAAPGAQVKINVKGTDASGATIDTAAEGLWYSFQRMANTEAVVGIYIPTRVVSTRALPFLPLAGYKDGGGTPTLQAFTVTFDNVAATDVITVTVPGYATAELREIAAMYNLPAGLIR